MFERRNEADLDGNPGLQDNLRDALREVGGQVILYGDTGVGKSSLLRYAAEDEGLDIVVVECLSSKSYEDLMEDAIRKLVDVREISRTSTTKVGAQVEGEVKVKWLVSLKGRLTGEKQKGQEFEVVQETPLDALLSRCRCPGQAWSYSTTSRTSATRTRAISSLKRWSSYPTARRRRVT